MENWRDILKREHEAQEGSFVIQLRCGPGWDTEAFARLFLAMRACCEELDGADDIPRWIADLFWYLDWYVRLGLDEGRRNRETIPEYYVNAWTNLDHLAHWLFTGEARSDDQFEPMEPDERTQLRGV